MKQLLCVFLALSILLVGCYSRTPITQDAADVESIFRLTNGTEIISTYYSRFENGYQIVGEWNGAPFEGFVADSKITEIVVSRFDYTKTAIAITLMIVVPIVLYFSLADFKPWSIK